MALSAVVPNAVSVVVIVPTAVGMSARLETPSTAVSISVALLSSSVARSSTAVSTCSPELVSGRPRPLRLSASVSVADFASSAACRMLSSESEDRSVSGCAACSRSFFHVVTAEQALLAHSSVADDPRTRRLRRNPLRGARTTRHMRRGRTSARGLLEATIKPLPCGDRSIMQGESTTVGGVAPATQAGRAMASR